MCCSADICTIAHMGSRSTLWVAFECVLSLASISMLKRSTLNAMYTNDSLVMAIVLLVLALVLLCKGFSFTTLQTACPSFYYSEQARLTLAIEELSALKFISFSWQFIDNILGNIFWQYSGPYRELRLERQFEDELPALTQATPPSVFLHLNIPGGFSRHSQEESNTVKNVHESWVVFLVFFFTVSPGSPTWEKFPYFPVFFLSRRP